MWGRVWKRGDSGAMAQLQEAIAAVGKCGEMCGGKASEGHVRSSRKLLLRLEMSAGGGVEAGRQRGRLHSSRTARPSTQELLP